MWICDYCIWTYSERLHRYHFYKEDCPLCWLKDSHGIVKLEHKIYAEEWRRKGKKFIFQMKTFRDDIIPISTMPLIPKPSVNVKIGKL